jgi:predicted HTH domain antitoxin
MTTITVPDELVAVLAGHPAPDEQIRELAVLELYRRRSISSGKAAELLSMEREEFIRYAGRLGIPYVDLDEIELHRELDAASRLSE